MIKYYIIFVLINERCYPKTHLLRLRLLLNANDSDNKNKKSITLISDNRKNNQKPIYMKKLIFILFAAVTLNACSSKTQWEYKIVKVAGQEAEVIPDFTPMVFNDQTKMLNTMGQDGWELVNTYTEINSAHPNFGNSSYVSGIRMNTRTSVLNFIFKRPQ